MKKNSRVKKYVMTGITLGPDQKEQLDALAERERTTRTAVIRRAIDRELRLHGAGSR